MRSKKLLSAVTTLAMLVTWVIPAAAASSVNNAVNQTTTSAVVINGGFQEAELQDNAFQNASGSIGMNNASGSLNEQANQLYINQTATELALNDKNTQDLSNTQIDNSSDVNRVFHASGNNEATYEDNVFQKASGNIGANNAAGNANQQQNTAIILSSCNNTCGSGPELTTSGKAGQISLTQTAGGLLLFGDTGTFDAGFTGSFGSNNASYSDNAFAGASGNIGANNAAGNLNQQGNQLALLTNGEIENLNVAGTQANAGKKGGAPSNAIDDSNNIASFDGSFSGASGNIGVNNAAGDMNQQSNQAVLNVAAKPAPTATQVPESGDTIEPLTLSLSQTSTGYVTNAGNQEAEFQGNAFSNASGNIGANNAAGTLNQQQNQLYLDVLAEDMSLSAIDTQVQSGFRIDHNGTFGDKTFASAGNNEATFEDNAFRTASGNIGVNNAAGNGNQQQNSAAIFSNTCVSSCGGGPEINNAEIGSVQVSAGNSYTGKADRNSEPADGHNTATYLDNAFQAASGNIGANNASGNMNQQANMLALITNGEVDGAFTAVEQVSVENSIYHDTGNVANFDGNAFANASGNVGANNAAGDMNQQQNLAVMNVAAKTTTPKVNEGSDATTSQTNTSFQAQLGTTIVDAGNQEGEFEGNAFSHATGNIGANNAGGTNNQQSNALYIDQLAESLSLGSTNAQEEAGVSMTKGDANGNQEATYEDSVFSNASGNIGVNNAGGNANQQQNSTTILANVCADPTCGNGPQVTGDMVDLTQVSENNKYDGISQFRDEAEGNNQATFEDNAFQNAKGNIGANNAAGNMNQQSNAMVLITNGTLSSLSAHIGQQNLSNSISSDVGNSALFQGNAFQNAAGNVSANNAAGDLNQQANQTIINTKP
ncbi:MAG TPA: hypothetical protein VIG32_06330 [Candidatus Baltobacteraceae bacterium]|jgi:hypothetical protein